MDFLFKLCYLLKKNIYIKLRKFWFTILEVVSLQVIKLLRLSQFVVFLYYYIIKRTVYGVEEVQDCINQLIIKVYR